MDEVELSPEQHEEKARRQGWVNQDEWVEQGKPSDAWRPADEFNRIGDQMDLRKTVDRLKREVDELRTGNEKFVQFHEQTLQEKENERARLIGELKAAQEKAVTDGDGAAFREAGEKLEQLKQPEVSNGENKPPEEFNDWKERNERYGVDKKFTAFADGVSDRLRYEIDNGLRARPQSVSAYFELLDQEMKDTAPELFENPKRAKQTVEDTSTATPSTGGGKSFDDLPEDAQADFKMFQKTMPGFDLDLAVKRFFEGG